MGRLRGNGAVRHGAECFNYYFPQDLDQEFLIVSDRLPGKVPWKYVNCKELQELLVDFVDQGFTFPMNPKWLLCDEGWMSIFNKLAESDKSAIKQSLEVWYPPHIQRRILDISARFPAGYQKVEQCEESAAKAEKDLAEFELEHFITMNTKTLFEKIGGDAALEKAIDEFYKRVVADPLLEPFFKGINMVRLKNHQRRFFKMAFTRIPASIDVSTVLIKKHARMFDQGLNESHFDAAIGHLVDALEYLGIPEEMIADAKDTVGPLRAVFAEGAKLFQ